MLSRGLGNVAHPAYYPKAGCSRFRFIRSRRTWARSYWACCTSQPSSAPPKTFDNLTAISGDIPRFSFTSSESVLRVTPRASAASVIVKPKGSMHWRKTTPPGCGGFFMVMARSPCLVVIDIINVLGVALGKTENHPPVGPNRYRPEAFHPAFERMQPIRGQVHMCNC